MSASTTMARAAIAGLIGLAWAPTVWACSCGCSGTGTAADVGAVGGAAGLYSLGSRFLIQEGLSLRLITGSFNETGTWTPPPVDGALQTLQGSLGVLFFPVPAASIGVTLPVAGNALTKAAWGPYGSISPSEGETRFGGGLGDVSLQGTYRFWDNSTFAVAGWAGALLPTGPAYGEASQLTGSGLWSSQLGVSGLAHLGDWQLIASAGAQVPLASTGDRTGTFGYGTTAVYLCQGYYRLDEAWRLGLGFDGYIGQASQGTDSSARLAMKLRLLPSVTWEWASGHGARLSLAIAPPLLGRNSMTETTLSLNLYQYL